MSAPVLPDPYWLLAEATGFDGLRPADQVDGVTLWPVSVQLEAGAAPPALDPPSRWVPSHEGSTHRTAEVDAAGHAVLRKHADVVRVVLAAAQQPSRPTARLPVSRRANRAASPAYDGEPPAEVLLGVIDNGCPFAHPDLLRADGKPRVLRLWNQDPGLGLPLRAPAGFGYGAEWSRADLHRLMQASTAAGGTIEAAHLYRKVGLDMLLHRTSHGAQVTGLLAGRRQWGGRADPLPRDQAGTAARADLAFVQLPRHLVAAVSVAHLEQRAYDGLRYLAALARGQGYRKLAVVLAYESWVGPHDGSGWFETAIDALVTEEAHRTRKLEVQVFTIAGNGRARGAHARVERRAKRATLSWHLPPGNELPCWMELWPDAGFKPVDTPLQLRLTAPGGASTDWLEWGQGGQLPGANGRMARLVTLGESALSPTRAVGLLRMEPTRPAPGAAGAEHGLWRLELRTSGKALPPLSARLGRLEADPQAPRRARSAAFVGRSPQELILDARQTLNGHAGGQHMVAVGATLAADFPYASTPGQDARGRPHPLSTDVGQPQVALRGGPAPYSGAARKGSNPNWSVEIEEGLMRMGRIAIGNTAAAVARVSGSSAAAPRAVALLGDYQAAPAKAAANNPVQVPGPVAADPCLGILLGR